MRENQTDPIFASAGEDARHRRSDQVVRLVAVQEKIATSAGFQRLTRYGELLELRYQECSEEMRVFFSDQPLGKPRQKDLSLVHQFPKVEPVFALTNHVPDCFGTQETVQAGHHGCLRTAIELREVLLPIIDDF